MTSNADRVLNGRYRLVRPVGHGAQASVWIADHLALRTQVAVKLIDPDLARKPDARDRFQREAMAAAQLRSAHVVQILDHGIDDGQPFIVMELLDGEDLFDRLERQGRLTLRETSRIVTQVARALTRAHAAGIVHRDLKPENIFLVANDDDEVAKVLDFGVAKISEPARRPMHRTRFGQLIGTPHYMSPEQVQGITEVDSRADLWSLGVIAYQCATGTLPFDSEGMGDLFVKITSGELPVPSRDASTLPEAFDAWFAKACARALDARFEGARAMAQALAEVVAAAPPEPVPSLPTPPRRAAADDADERPSLPSWPDGVRLDDPRAGGPTPTSVDLDESDIQEDPGSPPGPPVSPVSAVPAAAPVSAPWPAASAVPARSAATSSALASMGPSTVATIAMPPELDASRRRRVVRYVAAAFGLLAAWIAWTALRSQLDRPTAHPAAAGLDVAALTPSGPATSGLTPAADEVPVPAVDPALPPPPPTARPQASERAPVRPATPATRPTKGDPRGDDDLVLEVPEPPPE
jgi:serine/threonine-protein kinase